MSTFDEASHTHLNRIVEGASTNQQIYGGHDARDFVRGLIRDNRAGIKKRLVRKFEERAQSWRY